MTRTQKQRGNRAGCSRRDLLGGAAAVAVAGCAGRTPPATVDVAVIGAGLAGLSAADKLERAGARVVVFEATGRVGGRTYTARDLPDRGEYGGVQVGDSYAKLRALATRFDVAIAAFPHTFPPPVYAIGNAIVDPADWPTSPANPVTGELRAISPSRLIGHLLAPLNPLRSPTDWSQPDFSRHDRAIAALLRAAGIGDAAYRLADVNANYNDLNRASALNVWRSQVLRRLATRADVITDGSDALAMAVAASLGDRVRLNAPVASISEEVVGYRLALRDGGQWLADNVIVTAPPAAAARIGLDVGGGTARLDALRLLPFTAITQVFIDTPAFWENDGLAPHLWTDGPFERWFPRIDAATGEVIGFKIWLNGRGALAADTLTDDELMNRIRTTLARLRPASEGRATLARRLSWQRSSAFQHGAYPEWPAGRTASLAASLRQPLGRVQFAGDYTAERMTGLEGAVESGLRAAEAILAA